MRTLDEIEQNVKDDQKEFMSFAGETLIVYLPFERAKPYLAEDAQAADWRQQPLERKGIMQAMEEYMSFAIGKAENPSGLSAGRSVSRFSAWLWLLKDEALQAFAEADKNYENYGAPLLLKICQEYGFKCEMSPEFLAMAEGKPCRPGCDEGCGS